MKAQGRIVKGVGGVYTVACGSQTFELSTRGKIRLSDKLEVGDFVTFDPQKGRVEEILPRKNKLLRPALCNVDQVLVVLASSPAPDLGLTDRMLVFLEQNGIKSFLAVNKADLHPAGFFEDLRFQYGRAADGVLCFSALTGEGVEGIAALLQGKLTCLAGQSAVGKSTLLNALTGLSAETGDLSRIERGRHTTRHSQIYALGPDTFLADTPGFSEFGILIDPRTLHEYYPDFDQFAGQCRFRGCTHAEEPDCAVRAAAEDGALSPARYARYREWLERLKKEWERRY